jgi:hypothetical protein
MAQETSENRSTRFYLGATKFRRCDLARPWNTWSRTNFPFRALVPFFLLCHCKEVLFIGQLARGVLVLLRGANWIAGRALIEMRDGRVATLSNLRFSCIRCTFLTSPTYHCSADFSALSAEKRRKYIVEPGLRSAARLHCWEVGVWSIPNTRPPRRLMTHRPHKSPIPPAVSIWYDACYPFNPFHCTQRFRRTETEAHEEPPMGEAV